MPGRRADASGAEPCGRGIRVGNGANHGEGEIAWAEKFGGESVDVGWSDGAEALVMIFDGDPAAVEE